MLGLRHASSHWVGVRYWPLVERGLASSLDACRRGWDDGVVFFVFVGGGGNVVAVDVMEVDGF